MVHAGSRIVGQKRSPTFRLLAGLAVTLTAVGVYTTYTSFQLRSLRTLQAETSDRNRSDSLLLLRIQNDLNSLALAMRDMLDANEPYPLTAYQAQFKRIRVDLEDAMARKEQSSSGERTTDQQRFLASSMNQFWGALDGIFALAKDGHEEESRAQIRLSLQARQAALSTAVSRLLIQNYGSEQVAAERAREIYARVERNVYLFAGAMLVLIVATSLYLVHFNRRMFEQVAAMSERRSELARQLISMQENTFRSISRELHDEFGQILTAIGAMLHRVDRRATAEFSTVRADLQEVREIVQSTLEKVRSLSQALHPVVLDEVGFESALDIYLPGFERQTGIRIRYEKAGESLPIERAVAIHLYRVVQEALNNVARHSKSAHADVRVRFQESAVVVEIKDAGVGFRSEERHGMGLVSMRERAELVNGRIEFLDCEGGGALVRLTVPLAPEELHAGA
jgi:signal transduction histidine kinase